jgi:hypothetical protein
MKQALVVILASLLLSSCGFYKRQYTSGWMRMHHQSSSKQIIHPNPNPDLTAVMIDEQIPISPKSIIAKIDTLTPDTKDNSVISSPSENPNPEPDFYTAPPQEIIDRATYPKLNNDQFIQKKFDKRVKNATRGMTFMFGGFGYAILLTGLALNGILDGEIALFIAALGAVVGVAALIFMFFSTYKSYELIVNNPDVKFNANSRSKLIMPTVLSILCSGYIGLIFALVLVIKNKRNKK